MSKENNWQSELGEYIKQGEPDQIEKMLLDGYSHLFNEAEYLDNESYKQETKVKGYTRKQRSGSINEVIPDNTPLMSLSISVKKNRLIVFRDYV